MRARPGGPRGARGQGGPAGRGPVRRAGPGPGCRLRRGRSRGEPHRDPCRVRGEAGWRRTGIAHAGGGGQGEAEPERRTADQRGQLPRSPVAAGALRHAVHPGVEAADRRRPGADRPRHRQWRVRGHPPLEARPSRSPLRDHGGQPDGPDRGRLPRALRRRPGDARDRRVCRRVRPPRRRPFPRRRRGDHGPGPGRRPLPGGSNVGRRPGVGQPHGVHRGRRDRDPPAGGPGRCRLGGHPGRLRRPGSHFRPARRTASRWSAPGGAHQCRIGVRDHRRPPRVVDAGGLRACRPRSGWRRCSARPGSPPSSMSTTRST